MELLISLWDVLLALSTFLAVLFQSFVPWIPLAGWIAFWLLAVNWKQLYPLLIQGGWIGVALLMVISITVWSSISIPVEGKHYLMGLFVDNAVGKTVYVTGLAVIALLCGSVQLNGLPGRPARERTNRSNL